MKEILHVMRLDFISASSTAITVIILLTLIAIPAALLFNPFAGILMLELVPIIVIGPLQVFDGKYGNRLHGILPVHRKNITRGRFAMYAAFFLCIQMFAVLLTTVAVFADLNELLPLEILSALQEQQFAFETKTLPELIIMCVMVSICFWMMFSFFEMSGQIFGRENEMKIFLISCIGVIGLFVAVMTLTNAGILPYFEVPELPATIPGAIRFLVIADLAAILLTAAFSEITAHIVSKREI